ncbi:larval cuticle protein A3A [Drosophila novamexicana]|uniref:larval cuticle protein A3A n=1 Tax=Drosophila novamexicana TaxID=47314 RepID=UPI0011E5E096|nr:larval cuticle protein A3A [Drosophila novamexicana]
MFKFVLFASLLVSVALAAPIDDQLNAEDQRDLEAKQNSNAQYEFNSKVDDHINDGTIEREETRDGTKVTGSYSYTDGFVKRTVHYEADENGYRVIKDEMQDIGDGPVFNENGQADVQGSLIGSYSIKLDNSSDKQHYKGTNEHL